MDSLNSIKSAQLNGIINQYEIPATMRSDGTMRKARKVKPGFVPQEEIPLYTPKGKRNLAQPSQYPPGWHPSVAASTTTTTKTKAQKPKPPVAVEKTNSQAIEKLKTADKSKQTAEKSKIKEKKDVVPKIDPVDDINEKLQDASIDPTVEISKRLKRLRRRLRESEQLEEKINLARTAGEPTNPDQIEKCSRRKELEDEINQLEDERNKLRQLKASKNT